MTTTLYGWGRMFDLPSPSPFVTKADIQLQMLGIEFDRAIANLDSVEKRKAPYVIDNGQTIEDSEFIRRHFETKTGYDLDVGLSADQRSVARALTAMLENRLVPLIICERWLHDVNFERGPSQFFAAVPEAVRSEVIEETRGQVRSAMYGVGFGRYSRGEQMQIAAGDIACVATYLGDKAWLFGSEASAVDAVAYGALAGAATRFFDSELPDLVAAHDNLVAYVARVEQTYFPTDRWPAMG